MSPNEKKHEHKHEPQAIRAEALESLLVDKGLLTTDAIDDVIVRYSERVGPLNGARVVARAWVDPEFKERLLRDGTATIEEFGFEGAQTEKLVVVENTDEVHNAVVCTLCSCYPWAVLGLPPPPTSVGIFNSVCSLRVSRSNKRSGISKSGPTV